MKIKLNKPRLAKVLFVKDSPFKQKIVKDQTQYERKAKHRPDYSRCE